MTRYRKIPVVIDAWQWNGIGNLTPPDWLAERQVRPSGGLAPGEWKRADQTLLISTLEGVMIANPNDWIIKGVNGELYPCKPDIFAKTYVEHYEGVADEKSEAVDMRMALISTRGFGPDDPIGTVAGVAAVEMVRTELEFARQQVNRVTSGRAPAPIMVGPEIDMDAFEAEMRKPGYIVAMNDDPEIPSGMPILPPGWTQDVETGMVTDDEGKLQGIPVGWRSAPISESDPAHPNQRYTRFRDQLEGLINEHSMENCSDTPDFMLAELLTDTLMSFDRLMQRRDGWYGGSHRQLKAQLEAEGAHTAAANAQIDTLERQLQSGQ